MKKMAIIKMPRPERLDVTHGKNGVPELPALQLCTAEFHALVRDDAELFESLTKGVQTQYDVDGFPLVNIGHCIKCGSSLARVLSDEARMRIEELPEETRARHARHARS